MQCFMLKLIALRAYIEALFSVRTTSSQGCSLQGCTNLGGEFTVKTPPSRETHNSVHVQTRHSFDRAHMLISFFLYGETQSYGLAHWLVHEHVQRCRLLGPTLLRADRHAPADH